MMAPRNYKVEQDAENCHGGIHEVVVLQVAIVQIVGIEQLGHYRLGRSSTQSYPCVYDTRLLSAPLLKV